MTEFLWALRFLTIIPLSHNHNNDVEIPPQRMGVVMSLFPVVGLCIGLILVLCYIPLIITFPSGLADALIIVIFIALTGALHLDGLADTADGVWGAWDAEKRLEIMKDSRTGTFGVVALLVVLGLKYLSFNGIEDHVISTASSLTAYLPEVEFPAEKATVLLLMPVVGRWAQTLAAGLYPYARDESGTAHGLVVNTQPRDAVVATAITVFFTGLLLGGTGLIIAAVLAVAVFLQAFYINSRTGGLTGDTLGAINEVTELSFLLLFYVI
ncbi:MAG: adenosylcobinamide-GDP ribazoletransferase [Planctomycetes bacterium]|nr:adenosylcobinamide-GDP ribazoletransferase [Planctomycetota bacterium]